MVNSCPICLLKYLGISENLDPNALAEQKQQQRMETIVEILEDFVSSLTNDDVSTVVSKLTRSMDELNVRTFYRNPPTIHRIPIYIRKGNESAYAPKLVSIGPYHRKVHQGSYLHELTEGMKILYLRNFLHRTSKDVKHYVSLIKSREEDARDCYYDRCNRLKTEEFVQMMVLDGCFIIEVLLKCKRENKIALPLIMSNEHNWRDLCNDLVLMENQIPFFILKLILDNSGVVLPEVQGGVTVNRMPEILDLCLFFLHGRKITKDMLQQTHQEGDGENVYHLLHLSYLCHMVEINPQMESPPGKTKKVFYLIAYGFLFLIKCFLLLFIYASIYVLDFIKLANKTMWQKPDMDNRRKVKRKPKMIPTATELNEFGVTFKRKHDAKNRIDVSFENGIMEIPEVLIADSSSSEFRNYLALEQNCPEVGNKFSSYAVFMDDLVDTPSDVALLKKRKIIVSMLGCDEEVAKFFNGLTVGLVFDSNNHYLQELFEEVRVHSKTDHNKWRAKLTRDYFGSPWSIISLFGAFTLLAFAATQVAYAIKRSHRM